MHFWIDKSRFGGHPCAFGANRHRPIGGRRWRSPKPNVVPVHRFNSVDNLHSPIPSHSPSHGPSPLSLSPQPSRPTAYAPSQMSGCSSLPTRINIEEDGDEENIRLSSVYFHNVTYARAGGIGGSLTRNNVRMYGILPSIVLSLILIIYTKFNSDTLHGYEMITIIGVLGIFVAVWHAVFRSSQTLLCPPPASFPAQDPSHHPSEASHPPIATIPPPPYHIAVLLPSDPKDLPPPSYDHALKRIRKK